MQMNIHAMSLANKILRYAGQFINDRCRRRIGRLHVA